MIYADNAATTRVCSAAIAAMLPVYTEFYANPSSLHTAGVKAAKLLESAREKVASCLGCNADEIVFTSGGSEADAQALASAAFWGEKSGKKHIVSTAIEHHAVLNTLEELKNRGFSVTLVPVDESGIVSAKSVADAITPQTALVSVMYANNEIGAIQPINELCTVCRERGVPLHTDAVQAVGHLPIDIAAQDISLLSLSAHKFGGPKGVGALVSRRMPLLPLIRGGGQERGLRAGTENLPSICGMAAALEESVCEIDSEITRLSELRDYVISELTAINGVSLCGDAARRLPGNVCLRFEGQSGEGLSALLDMRGISVSAGAACHAGSLSPSHVLLALGLTPEEAASAIRISLGKYNTAAEAKEIVTAIKDICREIYKL